MFALARLARCLQISVYRRFTCEKNSDSLKLFDKQSTMSMSHTVNTAISGRNMIYSRQQVIHAISKASKSSGVDFSYLLNQAATESNFDPDAKAKTSSATGLYQFIDSTWLSMIKRYGDVYGIETQGKSMKEILNMRNDPETSSFMAAAFASENEKFLNNNWGGKVGATELYFAHFMGASGAASFLKARDENPIQNAADLFPRAARANRNVFYNPNTGKSRTLEEVYSFFDKKFNNTDNKNIKNYLVAGAETDADAPVPPSTPSKKLTAIAANNNENSASNVYSPSRSLSDNIIMQRAQAMRDAARSRSTYANALYRSSNENAHLLDKAQKNPRPSIFKESNMHSNNSALISQSTFSELLAQPLDLMMLTQISVPTKVIDDNG